MSTRFLCLLLAFVTLPAFARPKKRARQPAETRPIKLTKVGSCVTPADGTKPAKAVMIVKQWHLAPKIITKSFKEKYPQERNQQAIYSALSDAVRKKSIQLVVSEGCEGEINSEFKPSFNGWDYASLRAVAQTKGYDKILTLVPLKLEARFGDELRTMCGDDEKLIQEGNMRLSNLRGWMGFWTRLHDTYPDDKGKLFADAAADLMKIPRTTPLKDVIVKVREHVQDDLAGFKKSLADRNAAFVKVLGQETFETAAVVIGGLHTEDLKLKLQLAGMACDVYEPPGYQREDEDLMGDFLKVVDGK